MSARRSDLQRAGGLINSIMADLGLEDGLRLWRLRAAWGQIFGPPLCLHMSPSSLKGRTLVINVDSPAWLQELNFKKNEIIRKLGAFGINGIRLRGGWVADPN